MPRICFVSDEIYPTRPGGAGSVIYNLAGELLAAGCEVLLLLNLSRAEFEQFERVDRLRLPRAERCRAYHVAALCAAAPFGEDDFASRYDWEAACYDFACRQVYDVERPELIEFVDYCGPAYYALCAKWSGLSYAGARILVRLHGAIELIDRYAGPPGFDYDRYCIYALERRALRLADGVLYPVPSFLAACYPGEAQSWPGEKRLAPPVVQPRFPRLARAADAHVVLFYGRLYAVKGADLFVDAAVAYLRAHPQTALRFHLAGADSPAPSASGLDTYREYLLTRIPAAWRSRFSFLGFVPPERLAQDLPQVSFAVFPGIFETFCLAAHELRQAGVPLLLSRIPAFTDHFRPGEDALFFDGSREDLLRQIERLDGDAALLASLSAPPVLLASPALDFYRSALGLPVMQAAPPAPGAASAEVQPPLSLAAGLARRDAVETQNLASLPPPTASPPEGAAASPGLLVCILAPDGEGERLARTLASLDRASLPGLEILCLSAAGSQAQGGGVWLLGGWYACQDRHGRPLPIQQARTRPALLLLCAGDEVQADYLRLGVGTLRRHPTVAGLACWQWVTASRRRWLYTFPLAAMPELLPFEPFSPFTRSILRTPPGVALVDFFDPRAGPLAEIACLWRLADEGEFLHLPAPLLARPVASDRLVADSYLSYLVLRESSAERSALLSRYLLLRLHAVPGTSSPLRAQWARQSGLHTWRMRWVKRLERGGLLGRGVLGIMRRLKDMLK